MGPVGLTLQCKLGLGQVTTGFVCLTHCMVNDDDTNGPLKLSVGSKCCVVRILLSYLKSHLMSLVCCRSRRGCGGAGETGRAAYAVLEVCASGDALNRHQQAG